MYQKDVLANDVLAVSAKEAARLLGVSERALWNWAKDGLIRTVKIGRRVLYPITALKELLDQGGRKQDNSCVNALNTRKEGDLS